MRFHLPALPGQPTVRANSSCAYTSKVLRFSTMMHDRGHDVFIYGGGDNDARCTEYVACYGDLEPVEFSPQAWAEANHSVLMNIGSRAEAGDYLCLIAGRCQEKLAALLDDLVAVEFGIGYGGSFADF